MAPTWSRLFKPTSVSSFFLFFTLFLLFARPLSPSSSLLLSCPILKNLPFRVLNKKKLLNQCNLFMLIIVCGKSKSSRSIQFDISLGKSLLFFCIPMWDLWYSATAIGRPKCVTQTEILIGRRKFTPSTDTSSNSETLFCQNRKSN